MDGDEDVVQSDSAGDRRAFLKRMAALAFAAPVISSFVLDSPAFAGGHDQHDQHGHGRSGPPNQYDPNQTQKPPPNQYQPNQTVKPPPNQYQPNQTTEPCGPPNQYQPNQTVDSKQGDQHRRRW
jgi:hypothetical protein